MPWQAKPWQAESEEDLKISLQLLNTLLQPLLMLLCSSGGCFSQLLVSFATCQGLVMPQLLACQVTDACIPLTQLLHQACVGALH